MASLFTAQSRAYGEHTRRPVVPQDPRCKRSRIVRKKPSSPRDDRVPPGGLTTLRSSGPHKEEIAVPLTQTQLAGAVADCAEITRAEAKRVLDALEDVRAR